MRPFLLVLMLFALASCAEQPGNPLEPQYARGGRQPLGIVLFIGDGMGSGALEASRPLVMEMLPVQGWQLTASADRDVTDSAAGATALATGVRTKYTYLSIATDGVTALETLIEAAEKTKMATGVVVTSSVTHATPAAFLAHMAGRGNQSELARQIAFSGVDVLFGGGSQWFDGAMLHDLRRHQTDARLFYPDSMPRLKPGDSPRTPTLAQMTSTALDILLKDSKGFVLMVEGSQIDWAGHNNDIAWLRNETRDMDAAVRIAIEKLANRPNTLIVVTADHETGGVAVENGVVSFSTTDHTGVPVPVFAMGSSADYLRATRRNDEIGQLLLRLVRGQ